MTTATDLQQLSPEDIERITEARVQEWLNEAHQHRAYIRPRSDDPEVVHEALVEVGGRLGRLEGILEEVTGYLGGLQAVAWKREEEAQDAWDDAIAKMQARAVRREYEGAQERYALARLESRVERHRARVARLMCDPVATCEKRIRLMYWGLRELSGELQASLRHLEFQTVLGGP